MAQFENAEMRDEHPAFLTEHWRDLRRILNEGERAPPDRELIRACVAFVLQELGRKDRRSGPALSVEPAASSADE
jgi:hypothetical protein